MSWTRFWSDDRLSFLFFALSFLGYSKDRFLSKGDLYYHPMHTRRRRPRHGAFFHLEIPSVTISGASRANEGRVTEWGSGGNQKGDGKVARLAVSTWLFWRFSFFLLAKLSFILFFWDLMCCDGGEFVRMLFYVFLFFLIWQFEKLGTSRWRMF